MRSRKPCAVMIEIVEAGISLIRRALGKRSIPFAVRWDLEISKKPPRSAIYLLPVSPVWPIGKTESALLFSPSSNEVGLPRTWFPNLLTKLLKPLLCALRRSL